ncbi:MAG TPA: Na(+)-translocating NADH-quinone reductase subunit A [Woeseiaceae bacterium]|nr:Na(+)-translocating NADH-quinone reductase subunit A [Woeseiaceae bacterium]
MRIVIRKGLDIPLDGEPDPNVCDVSKVSSVAVLGSDFVGLRPKMAVSIGDRVKLGEVLFTDNANPGVSFTSPGCGEVIQINRGARRALQSVVVRLDGNEAMSFPEFSPAGLSSLDGDTVRQNLLASGLWTAFRTRPFSRIPAPDSSPAAIFVTAMDSSPLAVDPDAIVLADELHFKAGLRIISTLTDGRVYICTAPNARMSVPNDGNFKQVEFDGPHPAGLVGTHIHYLHPVSESRTVWHLRYFDVIAIGELFLTGRLPTERVIALCGPMALRPRLLRTRVGASTSEMTRGETRDGKMRVISGSVLSGHRASGPLAWLGRYHSQLTLIAEGGDREFLSWMRPGNDKYSALRAYTGHLLNRGRFRLGTSQNGSPRAMVPIGTFERVMPLDILATPLLKALLVEDTEKAKALGCLELDEEDLALCTFVCSGKYEYGPFLRMNLDEIEANG